MHERKKTAVHGTLGMLLMAWKFNFKQLLSKTLNSRMNIIETRAVLNMVKKVGKCAPEAKCIFPISSNFVKERKLVLQGGPLGIKTACLAKKSKIYQKPSQCLGIIFHFENIHRV